MRKLIFILMLALVGLGGCMVFPTNPDDHYSEDWTGPDDTEDWW